MWLNIYHSVCMYVCMYVCMWAYRFSDSLPGGKLCRISTLRYIPYTHTRIWFCCKMNAYQRWNRFMLQLEPLRHTPRHIPYTRGVTYRHLMLFTLGYAMLCIHTKIHAWVDRHRKIDQQAKTYEWVQHYVDNIHYAMYASVIARAGLFTQQQGR